MAVEICPNLQKASWSKVHTKYLNDNRIGDHICYISDTTEFKLHYPHWQLTKAVDDIIDEMVESELRKQKRGTYGENLTWAKGWLSWPVPALWMGLDGCGWFSEKATGKKASNKCGKER